jgi:hypothetical protein
MPGKTPHQNWLANIKQIEFKEIDRHLDGNRIYNYDEFICFPGDDYKLESDFQFHEEPIEREISLEPHKDSYFDVKKEFENTHFFLKSDEKYIEVLKDGSHLIISPNCLLHSFKHRCYTPTPKGIEMGPFITTYLKDKYVKTVDRFVFKPYLENNPALDCEYNLFKGFNFKPTKRPELKIPTFFNKYLEEVLAPNDIKLKHFIINWMAHKLQFPNKNTGVCLVMVGAQGSGKDSFVDLLEKLMGRELVHRTANMDDVFGTYNGGIKKTCLLQFDETSGKDSYANKEKIKNLITATSININEKYQKPFVKDNTIDCVMCSNNERPVMIEASDRRMVVIETSDAWVGKQDTWDRHYLNTLDQGAMQHLFNFLVSQPLQKWVPQRDRPITKRFKDIQIAQTNIITRILYEKLKCMKNADDPPSNFTPKMDGTREVFIMTVKDMKKEITDLAEKQGCNKPSIQEIKTRAEKFGEWGKNINLSTGKTRCFVVSRNKKLIDALENFKFLEDDFVADEEEEF